MEPEIIAYLDTRFLETAQQIQALREEVGETQNDIRALAKGFIVLDEKLQSIEERITQELSDVRKLIHPAQWAMSDRITALEVRVGLRAGDPIRLIKERILGRPPG